MRPTYITNQDTRIAGKIYTDLGVNKKLRFSHSCSIKAQYALCLLVGGVRALRPKALTHTPRIMPLSPGIFQ